MNKTILDLFNDRENKVIYDKRLKDITGSLTSSILLQQIIYWSSKSGGDKFYKFVGPCNHELYKKGDSWCEELGFTRKEFDGAIKKIGFKLGKNENKIEKDKALVIYYTDKERITWYLLNWELLSNLPFVNYKEIYQKGITIPIAETTTETTNKRETSLKEKNFLEFYSKYPRKISKLNAEKSYNRTIDKELATHKEIMKGLDNYITYIGEMELISKYIKHPATWLNQGDWDNDYEKKENKKKKEITAAEMYGVLGGVRYSENT